MKTYTFLPAPIQWAKQTNKVAQSDNEARRVYWTRQAEQQAADMRDMSTACHPSAFTTYE